MRRKVRISFILIAVSCALLFIEGCTTHKATALLMPPQEGQEKIVDSVTVKIKALRDFESVHFFDTRLISHGIQPLQIYIKNSSESYYVLNGENISLPLIGKRGVGAYLYKNTYARALLLLAGTVSVVWQVFLPLLVLDVLFCSQTNKQIKTDVESICINPRENIVLEPKSAIHKVLFIAVDDYQQHLSVTLVEQDSDKKITFDF